MRSNEEGPTPPQGQPSSSALDTADSTAFDHLGAALSNPEYQFSRAEVAILIDTAFRWGYEHRVDQENGAYPPEPIVFRGQWWDQADERRKHDAETARLLAEQLNAEAAR